jgi:hypothetical protein
MKIEIEEYMDVPVAAENVSSLSGDPIEKGSSLRIFETLRLKPSTPPGVPPGPQTSTMYANSAQGASVTFELERVPNTGGHYHGGATREPLAVGTIAPASVAFTGPYPQNVPIVFTAPQVCGQVYVTARFSTGTVIKNMFEIMYDSLLPVPQSTGIELKPPEAIHPSGYWADPPFITKLRELGEKYFAKRKKNIVITDASLPWGGRFDIQAEPKQEPGKPPVVPKPWDAPHAEHWNGRQADVRLSNMTADDKKAFEEICVQIGIKAEIHNKNHWHIRLL